MAFVPVTINASDFNANALVGAKLFLYAADGVTPQAGYRDSTGGSAHTNPVICNAGGAEVVWLDDSLTYRLVLQDAAEANTYFNQEHDPSVNPTGLIIYPQTQGDQSVKTTDNVRFSAVQISTRPDGDNSEHTASTEFVERRAVAAEAVAAQLFEGAVAESELQDAIEPLATTAELEEQTRPLTGVDNTPGPAISLTNVADGVPTTAAATWGDSQGHVSAMVATDGKVFVRSFEAVADLTANELTVRGATELDGGATVPSNNNPSTNVVPNVEMVDERVASARAAADAAQSASDAVSARTVGIDNEAGPTIDLEGATSPVAQALARLAAAFVDGSGNVALGIGENGDVLTSLLRVANKIVLEGAEITADDSVHAFALADVLDNIAFAISRTGDVSLPRGVTFENVETNYDWSIADAAGNVLIGMRQNTLFVPKINVARDELAKNARNQSYAEQVRRRTMDGVQLPLAINNTIVNYGQSLAEGDETWPSLSKTAVPGCLMVGDNVDARGDQETYETVGAAILNPLVAHTHDGTLNLDAAGEAALAPGASNVGEPPVIGLTNGFMRHINRHLLSADHGRQLVAISPARGGRTIEALSKVNTVSSQDHYSGVTDGVTLVDGLSGSDSHAVVAVTWLQGEANYSDNSVGTRTRAGYKTLADQLFNDLNTDILSITGQAQPPLKLTYQTGGVSSRVVDGNGDPDLFVGMAQIELMRERSDTVMVGPTYPYTDKGLHLDPNGSRWWGNQAAKVARRVLIDREGFEPLRPIEVVQDGRDIFVHFHVPVAPLRFKPFFNGTTATNFDDYGFRITSADDQTEVAIAEVAIVAETIVKITCAALPPADALVWYAGQIRHNGSGNLCDSDPALGADQYEYVPDRGAYAEANIPELINKPYTLENWCVAFVYPLGYSEF